MYPGTASTGVGAPRVVVERDKSAGVEGESGDRGMTLSSITVQGLSRLRRGLQNLTDFRVGFGTVCAGSWQRPPHPPCQARSGRAAVIHSDRKQMTVCLGALRDARAGSVAIGCVRLATSAPRGTRGSGSGTSARWAPGGGKRAPQRLRTCDGRGWMGAWSSTPWKAMAMASMGQV